MEETNSANILFVTEKAFPELFFKTRNSEMLRNEFLFCFTEDNSRVLAASIGVPPLLAGTHCLELPRAIALCQPPKSSWPLSKVTELPHTLTVPWCGLLGQELGECPT